MPRQYPQQFRERALRMVEESLPEHETEFAAMKKVATKLGISPEAIQSTSTSFRLVHLTGSPTGSPTGCSLTTSEPRLSL